MPATVWTIGHSTRPAEEFIRLLKSFGVQRVVDVRTVPRSRHNPQFNADALAELLPGSDIEYIHDKDLGGLRHPRKDSVNTGWRNDSFRGFADYMQSAAFTAAVERLAALAAQKPTAIMCAEAVPWRCHRSLIADALTLAGIETIEILDESHSRPHKLTSFAVVENGALTYPPPPEPAG